MNTDITQYGSLPMLVGGICILFVAFRALWRSFFDPLAEVPGPLAARFTRLWYFKNVLEGNFHHVNINLHRKYGPVVRIAPGQFSIDDPEAINIIYGLRRTFPKSAWYEASGNPRADWQDLFTDRDAARHAANRRLVANLYSATALRAMEDSVSECICLLQERMRDMSSSGEVFDLQFWMQCFAFDVIGQITVAKRFGFLERGSDDENIFGSLDNYLRYCALVGIVPNLHRTLHWLMSKLPADGLIHVGMFTRRQVDEGMLRRAKKNQDGPGLDFLNKTLEMHEKDPERFPAAAVLSTCTANIGAGSDTTAISLCGILFNLMVNPGCMAKLRKEVDEKMSELGDADVIPFRDAQTMPYLQACIKEGLRIYPATGLPLGRVVPEGGATISGKYFPAGTTVGINTWVAHSNPKVFGKDAMSFRPERWVEASKEALSLMDRYYIPFGSGTRTCIGKNISLMEINKVIPLLVKNFDFAAIEPGKVEQENFWFVKPKKMYCTVATRNG